MRVSGFRRKKCAVSIEAWRICWAEALEARVLLTGAAAGDHAISLFDSSPALFVENQGQWADQSVRYAFQGSGTNVLLTDAGPVIQVSKDTTAGTQPSSRSGNPLGSAGGIPVVPSDLQTTQFSMSFMGGNLVQPVGLDQSQSQFNYFLGNDKSLWRSGVPTFAKVEYQNLYNGIDLVTSGGHSDLKYEFDVGPGADWQQIKVQYSGIEGLSIDASGALHVQTKLGDVVDEAPVIYQMIDGKQVPVTGEFELDGQDAYRFRITGTYNPAQELIIDPDLSWATYLGGSSYDDGFSIALDGSGNALVAGATDSWNFAGANNGNHGGNEDAFVAKVSDSGSLLWATYLGGSSFDQGYGIAVDGSGNVLVTGFTNSTDFSGANNAYYGNGDAFVAKVSASGSLLWATYLGGSNEDEGWGIAVDGSGNSLLTGVTYSTDFSGANNAFHGGYEDAFVAKVSTSGSLLWATYLGGNNDDEGYGIALDGSGNALVAGATDSTDFSGANNANYGDWDAFVAKVSASGSLLWTTYLGGSGDDVGWGIAVDGSGNSLVVGETDSTDFSGGNNAYYGNEDAFVAKVSTSGSLLWATYLGGSNDDHGHGITVDGSDNTLVTGYTTSTDFSGANNASYGDWDAFVAKVSASGSLLWATYLGGSGDNVGVGIALNGSGNALVAGWTASADFSGANNAYHGGSDDAFLVKVSGAGTPFIDVGDSLSTAANLGTLGIGDSANELGQIGDGPYLAKDVDLYRFTLAEAGTVAVAVDAQSQGSLLDAYLRLFDANGKLVAANDDSNGRDPALSEDLSAGIYYIGVSGYPNRYYDPVTAGSGMDSKTTGPYTLSLTVAGAPPASWSPIITASATDDGNSDPNIFGRYLTGSVVPDLNETFTVSVDPPSGYTTAAVCFDSNFDGTRDSGDATDSTSGNGWTWTLDVSRLSGNKTLKVWAQDSSGDWSSAKSFTIKTLAAPAWMDPLLTTITFDAAHDEYAIHSLIGRRIGVDTPSSWPSWLSSRDGQPTFNGMYFGTSVEADCLLDGTVINADVSGVLGFQVLGFGPAFKFELNSGSGSVEVDPYKLWQFYSDPSGYWTNNTKKPSNNHLYKLEVSPPTVTIDWSGSYTLHNDLTFGHLDETFSIACDASNLFSIKLPTFSAPVGATGLDVAVTPDLSFGPLLQASWTTSLSGGQPVLNSTDVSIGAQLSIGATAELEAVRGLAAAGIEADATGQIAFDASQDASGAWSLSVPAQLSISFDLIGSFLWGVYKGTFHLATFSVTTDLYSSNPTISATDGVLSSNNARTGQSDDSLAGGRSRAHWGTGHRVGRHRSDRWSAGPVRAAAFIRRRLGGTRSRRERQLLPWRADAGVPVRWSADGCVVRKQARCLHDRRHDGGRCGRRTGDSLVGSRHHHRVERSPGPHKRFPSG